MSKKDKFKKALSTTGNGLLTAATVLSNAPVNSRISEIDEEIEKLQQEKADLEERLISYR